MGKWHTYSAPFSIELHLAAPFKYKHIDFNHASFRFFEWVL
ncbi:hypothetical protein CLV60_101152 [Dyadobacter jiangsuensis]|uniref:Uncharacterized protein n=1 Tax=Dyadobacter jiangsuensis TaxID=1591085 RepID=A0A2P8GIJ0_9BACT|nr:hypothetical protein CLV60_101152 [Dyadobacter jiangsuensis]